MHQTIQLRIVSLLSCVVLFFLGTLMGFFSWIGLTVGAGAGLVLGVLFWLETRGPARRERQFPVTNTQKVGNLPLLFLYAVFLGCLVDRISETPSTGFVKAFLGGAFFGSLGLLMLFNLVQLLRLSWYTYRGGLLDRFLWRDRQTGRAAMIGLPGVVTERIAPQGKVRVRGELWNAESVEGLPLDTGRDVIVEGVSGLTLRVRPGTP